MTWWRARTKFKLGITVFFVVLLSLATNAQGGYSTEKHPELGFDFISARDYDAIPIPPDEEWTILYFAEQEAFRENDRKRFRPELRFVFIDHNPPPTPKPKPKKKEKEEEDKKKDDKEKDGDAEEEEEEEILPPISNFEIFAHQKLDTWDVGDSDSQKDHAGHLVNEYELTNKRYPKHFVGKAITFSNESRTIAVYGFCAAEDYWDQVKIWRKMLKKIKFYEPEAADTSELELYYSRNKFKNSAYRVQVRQNLVDGWKAEDTENYILVYSTKDEPLIRIIKRELEAIRNEYIKEFPPVQEVEAVSTVRICKDEAEYHKYGGPRGTGGYWYDKSEELVFYDRDEREGEKRGTGKANTRIVLYHEAFHQYIYYAIGKIAPHSWFNEGTGDYYSGAVIKSGKVKKIGVNPWRIEYIQAAINGDYRLREESFEEILAYSQADFYEGDRVGVCYSQAWSMIYFLRTAKEVRKHPVWSTILKTYFDTLQVAYAKELEGKQLEELDEEELDEAKQKAREAALTKAFSDVDLRELRNAWRKYTLGLKVPR
ncbi:MAG: hypothetical protein ACI8TQ_001209 [Planctomycetota bacterium]|jgi:hypothetical protein